MDSSTIWNITHFKNIYWIVWLATHFHYVQLILLRCPWMIWCFLCACKRRYIYKLFSLFLDTMKCLWTFNCQEKRQPLVGLSFLFIGVKSSQITILIPIKKTKPSSSSTLELQHVDQTAVTEFECVLYKRKKYYK